MLGAVAAKTGNPKLATLAMAARLDAFVKVKKAIDDMVTELVAEKAAEIEHRDYCIGGLNENERTTAEKVHVKERLESKVAGLKQEVKELGAQITELTNQIAEMNTSLERAQEDRDAQHQVYEGILADQEQTELLLTQALTVLKGVYASPVDESLVQMRKVSLHKQEPPAEFGELNKQSGATGIVMMIEQIIADTKELQAVTKHDEQVAEKEHTKFKEETKASITGKQDEVTDLTSQKSKSEQDLIEVTDELTGANTDLDDLHSVKLGLHGECDYILKNFEVRQEAQAQEIDALREAKAILSGMK
jgi:septal ring factor EnvC (AmiA/AmiB activator)